MEPVLMLVTIVSLLLGAAMSIIAWKLLRHQRAQSAARIEALQAMSAEADDPPAAIAIGRAAPRFADIDDAPLERTPTDAAARAPAAAPRRAEDAGIAAPAEAQPWDAIRDRPAARQSLPGRIAAVDVRFAATDEPRAPGRRWAALAGVAVVMSAGFASVYALYSVDFSSAIGRAMNLTASASPASAEPLQLLSLKHETDAAGTFVLTGLVQNPPGGRALRGVVAVVYLFDQEGRYFAGGKATLELASIHPGEESPFVVRISGAAGVARYRIGFRMDDGGVVAHVDRRGQMPGGTVEDATDDGARPVTPALPGRSEG